MEWREEKCFHALVLPVPAQGHINPLLRFSHLLLLHSPTTLITFVCTELHHLRCLSSSPPSSRIRFLCIPDGLPPHPPSSIHANSLESFLMLAEGVKQQQGLLEDFILASMSTPSPISCIISDSFFPWTQAMANRLHIKRVKFWTANATTLYAQQLLVTGKIAFGESGDAVKVVWGEDSELHKEILPQYIATRTPQSLRFTREMYEGIESAACIVVGTLKRLEGSILKAMPLSIPVRSCAPCATLVTEGGRIEEEEESECVSWLDRQRPSSVLYISFGSVAELEGEQMEEVAMGIEASKEPFLWVMRDESRRGVMGGFVERTRGRGVVIQWAPQRRVLSHPSVGGFLTHCGWNSTLESIAMGVPMLCWPIFADQPLNSVLIQKVWKVGLGFDRGENGIVGRQDVQKRVLGFLRGEEGKILRQRALHLAQEIKTDLLQEETDIEAFMRDVSG